MATRNRRKTVSASMIELLENRRLMSVTYGSNLIFSASGEVHTGTPDGTKLIVPTNWTANGNATLAPYTGFVTITPPPSAGSVFFTGGPNNSESDFFQTIDLSSIATAIDAGQVKFTMSAYLGGNSSDTDNTTFFANFSNSSSGFLSQSFVGPVTATNRNNTTEFLLRSTNGSVPVGTRHVQVQLHFEGGDGSYNDGYADITQFILTNTAANNGSIAGTVFNDADGNGSFGSSETGLGGVKVFIDKNNNGVDDSGEPTITTPTNGTYKFTGLTAGTYSVREVVPSTFRATTTNPLSVTVGTGAAVTGKNFGDSQTVVISGNIFNDANGNKKKDTGETNLANVIVYLDFNNNNQVDSFELKTATDLSGNYKFIVPFGTYIVRQVVPSGFTQTFAPTTLTLAKGAVSANDNFGDKSA